MTQRAEIEALENTVKQIVDRSPLAGRLRNIRLDPSEEADAGDFIRIIITLSGLDEIKVEQLNPIMSSIEEEIIALDERFPSVRFSDAA